MKTFKQPNVNAPRFRPDVYNLMSKEFFENFRKKHPKYKNKEDKELRKIIKEFNKKIYEVVIDKRDGVQLPESIGWLFIGTCQQSKKKNIDYAKSKKYGVTVTNNNFETDGKLAKIFFTNYAPKHKIKNREFWSFVASRDFKRAVAKNYPENWNMYIVVDATAKLSLAYQKSIQKQMAIASENKKLKTYNEFDL